ncbi:MAG: ferritin [Flavobacteriales bacterium]|nr:ferritin [Flavobacteriales bacterium]MCZ2443649.1 ferritin [Flavobacteriales bacterium]
MFNKKLEKLLNEQLGMEAQASSAYLAIASWCEINGLEGAAAFFYKQSDEERVHMLKLFRFINERSGHAIMPALTKPTTTFKNIQEIMTLFLSQERKVTESVNKLVYIANQEKDYTTLNFLQWYVSEQHEEETLAKTLLDKIKLIGLQGSGLYLIDKEIGQHASASTQDTAE